VALVFTQELHRSDQRLDILLALASAELLAAQATFCLERKYLRQYCQ
jgi:hypothetical protein